MGKLHHFKIQLSNTKKSISFDREVEFFHPKSAVHKQILQSQIMKMNDNSPLF